MTNKLCHILSLQVVSGDEHCNAPAQALKRYIVVAVLALPPEISQLSVNGGARSTQQQACPLTCLIAAFGCSSSIAA